MDLSPTADQVQLRSALGSLLAKESTPERIRKAERLGFDGELWTVLTDFGVPALAESVSLADLAVIAELAGEHLASAPMIESLVARRLLNRLGADVPDGIVTFCPRPVADGRVHLVAGGAVSSGVLARRDDELVLTAVDADVTCPERTLSGLALADVDAAGATVLAAGAQGHTAFASALADWRSLTAAYLAGVAAKAVALGVAYVKERHQFGQPIGSFQALQHQFADIATDTDGARLIAHESAWAIDQASDRARGLAAAAFTFAVSAAQSATATSLHAHGGYGYTTEYDIQLYFRRAKALGLIAGGNSSALDDVATLALGAAS